MAHGHEAKGKEEKREKDEDKQFSIKENMLKFLCVLKNCYKYCHESTCTNVHVYICTNISISTVRMLLGLSWV